MAIFLAPNLLNPIRVAVPRLPLVTDSSKAVSFTALSPGGLWANMIAGFGILKVYVPSKFGGLLEVGCTDTNALVTVTRNGVPVTDLAGNTISTAQTVACPVRPGEFEWFDISVANLPSSYNMWATFKEIGIAREGSAASDDPLIPWNFWFYPNARSQKEGSAWGSSTLQPCQKYEQAFGKKGVLKWEKDNHNDPAGNKQSWEGHCHNAAPAAMIFKEPPAAGVTFNKVTFSCEELKLLAAEFFGNRGEIDWAWALPEVGGPRLGPYQEKKPADNPKLFGKTAAEFHTALEATMIRDKLPVMMDMRDSGGSDHNQVWNQTIYLYESQMWETPGSGDHLDIQVKTLLHANDDLTLPNRATTGVPASVIPANPATGTPKMVAANGQFRREEELLYRLIFKTDGTIDTSNARNEWTYAKGISPANNLFAPRYIVTPKKPRANPEPDGNPFIDPNDVLKLLPLRDRFKP